MKKKQVTQEKFLEIELAAGVNPNNSNFVRLAEHTANQVVKSMKALGLDPIKSTVIDFGAGVGVYAEQLRKKGLMVKALDIWKSHRDFMTKTFPSLKVISKTEQADVMLFIEVAEHMVDEEIKKTISEIQPKMILFSSTSQVTENDEEWGHINIKSQDDWAEFWELNGYTRAEKVNKPTEWSVVLKRI